MADAKAKKPGLPDGAPKAPVSFVECTSAAITWSVGDAFDWFPAPVPTLTIKQITKRATGEVDITAEGLGGVLSVSVTVSVKDGKLDAQLGGLTDMVGGDKAADWVKQMNEWLAANHRKLDALAVNKASTSVTMTKIPLAAPAAAAPKADEPKSGVKAAPAIVPLETSGDDAQHEVEDDDTIAAPEDTDADVVFVEDPETGDVEVSSRLPFGPSKRPVGCVTAIAIAVAVIIGGGIVAFVVRDNGHHNASGAPGTTEEAPPSTAANPVQIELAGIPDAGVKAAITDAVAAGTVKVQSTVASNPTELSKKGEPDKVATVPGTQIDKLVLGTNIDMTDFGCGNTSTRKVVCVPGASPLTGKVYLFAALTKGAVPQPDAQHKVSFGLAVQDHAQIVQGNIFVPLPSVEFNNDWFQNATGGYSVFNQGTQLSLNYAQAEHSQLVRMPTTARFFESGHAFGFLVPEGAVSDGVGIRMDVFRGDNQFGVGTGNWSGTYTPAQLSQFLVYRF